MAMLVCGIDGCEYSPPSGTQQGLSMHRTKRHSMVPAVRGPRKKQLNAFIQEQNVETATAYVLAAKFPDGIAVDDFPRVIRLVKAVEHG